MILILMLTPLLIFSGCVSNLPIAERCSVSTQFDICSCHDYDFKSGRRVGDIVMHPIKYCNDMTGFTVEYWTKYLTPTLRDNDRRQD